MLQESGDGPDQQNVFSPFYVDAPILTDRDANSTADDGPWDNGTEIGDLEQRMYAQHDANYNTTSLTDSSGDVTERYIYSPYGTVTILNGAADADAGGVYEWTADAEEASDYDFKYLFQGARFDAVTGLYDLRNRDYSPVLERFLEQDPNPAGQYNDGANLYQMEGSNVIKHLDPSGLYSWDDFWEDTGNVAIGVGEGVLGLGVAVAVGVVVVATAPVSVTVGLAIGGAAVGGYLVGQDIYETVTGDDIDFTGNFTGEQLSRAERMRGAGRMPVEIAGLFLPTKLRLRGPEYGNWKDGGIRQGPASHFHFDWGSGLGNHHLPQQAGRFGKNFIAVMVRAFNKVS